MSRTVVTFNNFHLGDNLIFLHLLRAIAKAHVSTPFLHFCHANLIPQLQEAVADLPNILLEPFESELWLDRKREAISTWKNHGDEWVNSPLRWDWSAYTLWHHGVIANRMGYSSPFTCREHLLFDYPALEKEVFAAFAWPADFLIINSEPNSGQFKPMAEHGSGYLDELVVLLRNKGYHVNYTKQISNECLGDIAASRGVARWTGTKIKDGKTGVISWATLSDIGSMSQNCKHIIGIATGPIWPCINVHNNHFHEGRQFIALLDNGEELNLPHWQQCRNVNEVMQIAKTEGWI